MSFESIISILLFIGIIIGGVMYFMAKKMPFNYDTNYSQDISSMNKFRGGKKDMKHKYSNIFCMPTILNTVFVLFFVYIVYSMV